MSHELLPRLFVEAFGALPLRDASGRIAYLGFEQSVDTALAFSVEKMTGKRVESGILPSSLHLEGAGQDAGNQAFAEAQVAEAASEYAAAHRSPSSIERHSRSTFPFGARARLAVAANDPLKGDRLELCRTAQ